MRSSKYITALVASFLFLAEVRAQQQLSLQDALSLAQASNPDLKISLLEIEKASQEKVIARSLFLPSVSAGAQANHYFKLPAFFGFGENTEGGKIPFGRFGGDDQLNAAVTAIQPLYNPIANPSFQHAQLWKQQRIVAARAKQISVLSEIKETYLRILVLQERIRLTHESIERNEKVLKDSRLLLIQGKGLRVDTLRAYTSVKNLEPDLVKLTYAIETGKLELKSLIGADFSSGFTLSDSLTLAVDKALPTEDQIYQEAIANNPDFQMLKVQTQLDQQNSRVAASYKKPVLSLVAQYQVQTQANNLDYHNAHYPSSSYVGLQLSIPVFTGLSANARVKHADLTKRQSDLNVHQTQEDLRARVHEAIANNKEALLRLENTAIVQETAELSYNIIQYRYKSGISPRLELTDAELTLSKAQSNYLEAVYDYLSARIQLRKLTGVAEVD